MVSSNPDRTRSISLGPASNLFLAPSAIDFPIPLSMALNNFFALGPQQSVYPFGQIEHETGF